MTMEALAVVGISLALGVLVVLVGRMSGLFRSHVEQGEEPDRADRPAGPGAESDAVPEPGSVGPTEEPPEPPG